MQNFQKLCTPAKIYFAIAFISTIMSLFYGATIMSSFWKLAFAAVWTFILGWLCKKGYRTISWFLVALPYVFLLLAVFKIYHLTPSQKQFLRSIQLQGAYGQEAMCSKCSS
jgi:hypothetical protein